MPLHILDNYYNIIGRKCYALLHVLLSSTSFYKYITYVGNCYMYIIWNSLSSGDSRFLLCYLAIILPAPNCQNKCLHCNMCNVRVFLFNWSKYQLNCVTISNLDHPDTVRIVLIEWVARRLEWSFQSRQMLDTGVGHGGEWRGCEQRKKDHTGRGHVVRICMGIVHTIA